MTPRRLLSAAALAALWMCHATAPAGQLIDTFQDNNTTAEAWSAAWVGGGGGAGDGFAYRTRPDVNGLIGFSNKDAGLFTDSGNTYFQYGLDPQTADPKGSRIAASDRTNSTPAQRLQFAGLNVARGTGYDATAHKYLRFTAWIPATAPSWQSATADDRFVVGLGEPSPSVNNAIGPWSSDGSTLEGVTLTTTPTAFLVQIDNTTRFKVDPIFTAMFAATTTTRANIGSVTLGYRRGGVASAGTTNLGRMFFIDDVAFLNADPGYTLVSSGAPIDESGPGNSTTFTVVLNAQTTNPITINPVSSAPGQVTVSPASWTFIPSGTPGAGESLWNVAATFTLTAVDDFVDEPNTSYDITFTATVNDLAYVGVTLPQTSIEVLDDDLPAAFSFTPATSSINESGVGNSQDLTLSLASAPIAPVSVSFASSDNAQLTVSPTSWTFIPSGIPGVGESLWNSPVTVTATAVEDLVVEGNQNYTVTATITTTDPAFGALGNPQVTVTVVDTSSAVRDWKQLTD